MYHIGESVMHVYLRISVSEQGDITMWSAVVQELHK